MPFIIIAVIALISGIVLQAGWQFRVTFIAYVILSLLLNNKQHDI